MKTKHTPGPWYLSLMTGFVYNNENLEKLICTTESGPDCYKFTDEQLANARLIAAAPELLDACLAADWNSLDIPESVRDKLTAAIAKATGDK